MIDKICFYIYITILDLKDFIVFMFKKNEQIPTRLLYIFNKINLKKDNDLTHVK